MTFEEYYEAGIIPGFLDRIKGRSREEIDAIRKSLRSRERKQAALRMPTKREISKFKNSPQAGLGMSLKELRASVMARKGA